MVCISPLKEKLGFHNLRPFSRVLLVIKIRILIHYLMEMKAIWCLFFSLKEKDGLHNL